MARIFLLLSPFFLLVAQEPQQHRVGWHQGHKIRYVRNAAGQAVYDGDILLKDVTEEPPKTATAETLYINGFRWTNNLVPYVIDSGLPNTQRVTDAIAAWEAATQIRFVVRTTQTNYIRFQRSTGCNSYLGMIGGEQPVNLADGCLVPETVHEIGHALGIDHEQQRPDRDRYIFVDFDSLDRTGLSTSFRNIFDSNVDGPYDYDSTMHYRRSFESDTGRTNFETIPPGIAARQETLTPLLANTVKRMYGATVTDTTITSVPQGLQVTVDGVAYTTPKTFTWTSGSTHTLAYTGPQFLNGVRHNFATWSDGGAQSHSITLPSQGLVYIANTFAELPVSATPFPSSADGSVTVTPASSDGYYKLGSQVIVMPQPTSGRRFENFFGNTLNWTTGWGISSNPLQMTITGTSAIDMPAGFVVTGSDVITTVTSNWHGAEVSVDGSWQNTPIAPGWWGTGSSHTLEGITSYANGSQTRFVFDRWADGASNPRTITHNGGTYEAKYRRQFQVTLLQSSGGTLSITPASSDGFYDENTSITITATANTNFQFGAWDADLPGSPAGSTTLRLTRPLVAAATFVRTNRSAIDGPNLVRFTVNSGSTSASQSIAISGTNNAAVPFTITAPDSWVSVSTSSTSTPATLTFSVNAASLAPGQYRSPVRLISSSALNSPRVIYVEAYVQPSSGCTFSLSPSSTTVAQSGGLVVATLTASDPNCVWTASNNSQDWASLDTRFGWGSRVMGISVAGTTVARSATINMGGQNLALTQDGSAPTSFNLTITTDGSGSVTGAPANPIATGTVVTLTPVPQSGWEFIGWGGDCAGASLQSCQVTMSANRTVSASFRQIVTSGLHFVPITPCRVVDTRVASMAAFGTPALVAQTKRDFNIPQGSCSIPSTAAAYSFNLTVVPKGQLGFVTLWPAGQPQPVASTLNSLDGRIKANAAIVPAGTNGGVSVYATESTELILDINGYFVPAGSRTDALAFYPVTPCRLVDTRLANGPLGGPAIAALQTRSFPIRQACNLPSSALAFSLNTTVVPQGPLGFVTLWPTGNTRPVASTLNALTGAVTANAALTPANGLGSVDVYATDATHVILDVNGYFAAAGSTGALAFYTLTPCRTLDTRNAGSGGALVAQTARTHTPGCSAPSTARAYSFNATVVPPSVFGFLTLWPTGAVQPLVSTLNAVDGSITANAAIVPAGTGNAIQLYGSEATHLILDINGYFAP